MKKRIVFFLFISLFLVTSISALRISPAKVEGNFKPGLENTIQYRVDTGTGRDLELFVEGDLAEYVTLDKTILHEGGYFNAIMKLPKELEIPGPRRTYVGVKELVDEELVGALGVSVTMRALILIHVPYPGKYLETELRAHNVNMGEPITFELDVMSRGDEDLIMNPRIEIYTEYDELVETLYFNERDIESQETIKLQKVMNTTSLLSGDYYAVSKIDYEARTAESKVNFKIGELTIEIVNYSREILLDGIQSFRVDIESAWNDKIDGAYAEVIILNGSRKITEFKTSPTDLSPWETRSILGYIDTKGISPGTYDADVTVIYYGRDRGKSVNEILDVEFLEKEKNNYLLIAGVLILCILAVLILIYIFKNVKKKKK
jgi:hypothetical protein